MPYIVESSTPWNTPSPPTTSLPPLGKLSIYPIDRIRDALQVLRGIYSPPPSALLDSIITTPKRSIEHSIHDRSVPDSGYASAEEDDEHESDRSPLHEDSDDENKLEALRADPFERAFSIKWLTGLITRSDIWLDASVSDEDFESRNDTLEAATSLLSSFSGTEDNDDVALTRTFSFPISTSASDNGTEIANRVLVELNDAPLSKEDHTSVGLQSWGSSILLADRFCLEPNVFGLSTPTLDGNLRILELGAGTGMLSIMASKLLHSSPVEIVATDYHPDVLANLRKNVATNFPTSHFPRAPITITALDWEHPVYDEPFDKSFDIILAADVIYHPSHAKWIKHCIERLLTHPDPHTGTLSGVFWLIIPVRTAGRHEGLDGTVDALFPEHSSVDNELGNGGPKLVTLSLEQVGRQGSVGRADEVAYKLFKIGWA